MQYVANPITVTAFKITEVYRHADNYVVALENGDSKYLNTTLTARYTPVVGDYFVTQEDGYEYINPKDVFERKYSSTELKD